MVFFSFSWGPGTCRTCPVGSDPAGLRLGLGCLPAAVLARVILGCDLSALLSLSAALPAVGRQGNASTREAGAGGCVPVGRTPDQYGSRQSGTRRSLPKAPHRDSILSWVVLQQPSGLPSKGVPSRQLTWNPDVWGFVWKENAPNQDPPPSYLVRGYRRGGRSHALGTSSSRRASP